VQIRRRASEIEVIAPAKINLFFEVASRRQDGFHEIETLMVPVGLYDTLALRDDPSGQVTLQARWAAGVTMTDCGAAGGLLQATRLSDIPQGEENLAVRAVRLLADAAGINRGAKLRLVKRIPACAGLGGGSSDAAAAMLAANLAWGLSWSVSRLADIAGQIGSDVPFFLYSRPCVCTGRGERIKPIYGIAKLELVIISPPGGLSTAAVYKTCKPGRPPHGVDPAIHALRKGRLEAIGPLVHNRLLEPARRMSPWIDRVLDQLSAEHCPAVGMSGSGTSCFAVCRSASHARGVAARLRSGKSEIGSVWAVSSV
jgi:4-diphosphocytidyl-2-C-methyl-D-erythritol kinase